jgi:hypothetical protein
MMKLLQLYFDQCWFEAMKQNSTRSNGCQEGMRHMSKQSRPSFHQPLEVLGCNGGMVANYGISSCGDSTVEYFTKSNQTADSDNCTILYKKLAKCMFALLKMDKAQQIEYCCAQMISNSNEVDIDAVTTNEQTIAG